MKRRARFVAGIALATAHPHAGSMAQGQPTVLQRFLARVEGKLSKTPSVWTRRVDVVRRYERKAGVRVPIAIESVAHVLIAARSTFKMTYEYQDQRPARRRSPAARAGVRRGLLNHSLGARGAARTHARLEDLRQRRHADGNASATGRRGSRGATEAVGERQANGFCSSSPVIGRYGCSVSESSSVAPDFRAATTIIASRNPTR
jgi:hypothetical protein